MREKRAYIYKEVCCLRKEEKQQRLPIFSLHSATLSCWRTYDVVAIAVAHDAAAATLAYALSAFAIAISCCWAAQEDSVTLPCFREILSLPASCHTRRLRHAAYAGCRRHLVPMAPPPWFSPPNALLPVCRYAMLLLRCLCSSCRRYVAAADAVAADGDMLMLPLLPDVSWSRR